MKLSVNLSPQSNTRELSKREKEILFLVIEEYKSREIAEKLEISVRTVETHRKNILRKIQAKSSIGIFKYAVKKGWVNKYFYKE